VLVETDNLVVSHRPQWGPMRRRSLLHLLAVLDPEAWFIMDGNLYLYHSPTALERFKAATVENSKASVNWPSLQPK
jgi:hypothetical protein